jgi:hypothetical protein
MCDPVSIGLTVASSVVSYMGASAQASAQERIAAQQAQATYTAAEQQRKADEAETNRQLAETQQQGYEEKSDLIRQANEELGTLQASETALSDASLGNLYYETFYTDALNLSRVEDNMDKAVDQAAASKVAIQQQYLNTTRLAQNQAQNVMANAAASRNSAMLNIVSSTASAGGKAFTQQQSLNAIKGART